MSAGARRPVQDWGTLTVGEEFGPYTYDVTAEIVEAYRAITGDHVVEAVGGLAVAPPTVLTFPMLQMIAAKYEPKPGVIHASQVFHVRAPLQVGATLTVTGVLTEMRLKRGRRYFTVASTVTDGAGTVVAEGETVALYPDVDLSGGVSR